jgi:hypothetical protein
MKKIAIGAVLAFAAVLSACGGSGGTKIEGPTLSIDEVKSIVIDQLFINGGMGDEYSNTGEFSVYLRDAATGDDVACTRAEDGMEELSIPAIYYGGLSIPFVSVSGRHPNEMAKFQLVFVEQDSEGCPNPIDPEDDIAGITPEFMFNDLLGKQLWAENGQAAAMLRAASDETRTVKAMAPALGDGVWIDELYFKDGGSGDEPKGYYIFVDEMVGDESVYQCQVDDDLMDNIRYGDIVYAALGFETPCFEDAGDGVMEKTIRVGVYSQESSGPKLIGETDPAIISDMIGEKAPFTNGKGYVSLRGIIDGPFAAPVFRLEELPLLGVAALSYELEPSYEPTVELHIMNSTGDYVIACAGAGQDLAGVDVPGDYDGLDARFVIADGQVELFGFDDVVVRLVDRKDGLICPSPLGEAPTVLAESEAISPSDIPGKIGFKNGAGSVTLKIVQNSDN